MTRAFRQTAVFAVCIVAVACAKKPETSDVTVSITSPSNGDTLSGSAVHVTLAATGIEIAPAADARPETAHHHLYLDVDFPAVESSIPAGVAGVVHLGQAQKEYHWENVPPGAHRIIAVLADPGHIPLRPWVTDTVNFVVVAPPPADSTTKK
jgi:uncharacterized protein DUF4399